MKERILKTQKLSRTQYCTMASQAAIAACTQLEREGYYTDDNAERLWETAWSTADRVIFCEEADLADATWCAVEAARRHAKAIPGGNLRLKYIQEGRITPAWRVQLQELQKQKMAQ